jgi:hypothetical protein
MQLYNFKPQSCGSILVLSQVKTDELLGISSLHLFGIPTELQKWENGWKMVGKW